MVAINFRRTHSPSRLGWSEGWGPPGAQSAFIKWTGWTLAMSLVMMTAPLTLSWLLLLLLLLLYIKQNLTSVSLRYKSHCSKSANITILSANSKHRSQLPHFYQSAASWPSLHEALLVTRTGAPPSRPTSYWLGTDTAVKLGRLVLGISFPTGTCNANVPIGLHVFTTRIEFSWCDVHEA